MCCIVDEEVAVLNQRQFDRRVHELVQLIWLIDNLKFFVLTTGFDDWGWRVFPDGSWTQHCLAPTTKHNTV